MSFGTIVGGVISYFFSVVMGRMLGPAKFGDLGAISSLVVLLTAVSGAVFTVVMHYSGSLYARGNIREIQKLQRKASSLLLGVSIAILAASYVFVPQVVSAFNVSDSLPVYVALASIVFSFMIVVNKGILQGTQKFWQITLAGIAELGVKLGTAVLLVGIGLGLLGATVSMVVSVVGAYLVSFLMVKKLLKDRERLKPSTQDQTKLVRSDVFRYLWPTVLATIGLLIVMNLDIIFVKRFFSPDEAGQYIAVSTIAKIIFYVTGPISLVMFPLVTEQRARGEKHYQTLLLSLFLTTLISALLLVFYMLLSDKIVIALYGQDYGSLGYLLPQASWLVVALSLVNLMVQYFTSIRQFTFIYFFPPIILAVIYLVMRNHQTISEVLRYLQIGSALLFLLMLINYLLSKRLQLTEMFRNST